MYQYPEKEKYDLVVIGAGFWGASICREAIDRGMKAVCLDDSNIFAASRNATGFINLDWFKSNTVNKLYPDGKDAQWAEQGLDWLKAKVQLQESMLFSSYIKPEKREKKILWLDDVQGYAQSLGVPVFGTKATQIERIHGGYVTFVKDGFITSKNVAVACGAFTDTLLRDSGYKTLGVKGLLGRAFTFRSQEDIPTQVINHKPYKEYTIRPWNAAGEEKRYRIGDTVEEKRDVQAIEKLRYGLNALFPDNFEVEMISGYRPVLPKFHVEALDQGLVVATGGHRFGLCLAGSIAIDAINVLT